MRKPLTLFQVAFIAFVIAASLNWMAERYLEAREQVKGEEMMGFIVEACPGDVTITYDTARNAVLVGCTVASLDGDVTVGEWSL